MSALTRPLSHCWCSRTQGDKATHRGGTYNTVTLPEVVVQLHATHGGACRAPNIYGPCIMIYVSTGVNSVLHIALCMVHGAMSAAVAAMTL